MEQQEAIQTLEKAGFRFQSWIYNYDDTREAVLSKKYGALTRIAEVDPRGNVNGMPVQEYLSRK